MLTINYRPALHHPVYKGGYYFIVFWALLDLTMTLRHAFLYEGSTPIYFHLFILLAVMLPLFKRTIKIDAATKRLTYLSNIPREPNNIVFEQYTLEVKQDRKIGTIVITTERGDFNTRMTESYVKTKDKLSTLNGQL